MERSVALEQLRRNPVLPVVIVGAGVNGLGLFRELCLQGIDVLLVDQSDFCSGSSAAPSRMIHGGLRYLENGEFRLVRESLKERDLLLKNAPHYVKPLPTTIPIFTRFTGIVSATKNFFQADGKPANRGALVIKIGLSLYDFYTRGRRALPAHWFSSREQALEKHSKLNPNIIGTATYHDAWISYPERLCVELALDGEAANHRSIALNYVALQEASADTVVLRDVLTEETFTVYPGIVVNAGGAWIDFINERMKTPTKFIDGTKGSHLIVDNADLYAQLDDSMIFYENADNRVCIMFRLHGKVLVGSTDIRVDNPNDVNTTEEDITYMLESARYVFPSINIKRDEVVFHFCGVRPLPDNADSITGKISRDHSYRLLEPNSDIHFPIYSLIGGKWTTFRGFAHQIADVLFPVLGASRVRSSDGVPIGGGRNYPHDVQQWVKAHQQTVDIGESRLRTLLLRYGTRANELIQFISQGTDHTLRHHPDFSYREMEFIIEQERVMQLADIVLRRTAIALQGDLTMPLLVELAEIATLKLQWTPDYTQSQINRTLNILETQHGVKLPTL